MASTFVDGFTVTDVVQSSTDGYAATYQSNENGAVLQTGVSQKSLYDVLNSLVTKWNAAMAALDVNGGVAKTDYVSLGGLNALGLAGYGIYPNGIDQDDLVTLLTAIKTQFAAATANLDADATLTDADYNSLDVTLDTVAIKSTGYNQGAVLDFINSVITNSNLLMVKLDADI